MQESKQNKLTLLQQMIDNAERNIVAAKQIMKELNASDTRKSPKESEASQIVEGTFDGEKMVSMEGKAYPVPANYASKSKLVEGDILKLTITEDGSFVYKKISSVDTRKIIGTVMKDGKDKYYVTAEGRRYNVLLASLTYFKAKEGDEVILVVPKEKVSTWGAVESIITEEDRQDLLKQEEAGKQDAPAQAAAPVEPVPAAPAMPEPAATMQAEENQKNAAIEDEWMPSVDEIKKEGTQPAETPAADGGISDDLSS
jgi:bifunctional DNA-binding transcriptional regulator/antitoxin component of YhaV-PrlF toxin-antitoxin module